MAEKPKFYLTTPIYYANSRPHVGSAYTTIVCDVIARYKRMCGYDVAYLTGTDEHGVNIERAAEVQGITPQQLVDKNQQIFRDLWKLLGIQYTDFVRTTSDEHSHAVQTLVRRTIERDRGKLEPERSIYKAKYEGRYCIYDNLYVSDTPEPANCQICGRPAELISEENYFFRLSAYQQRLLDFYTANPQWVQPDFRFNEVKSFVQAGLKDVSISRKTIKWGIPWPDDPEHVFYVWYDALTSYMSGIGYASDDKARADRFARFWPADVHMIGKEIIRFHAVYWPAFLMAADLPLPKKIVAHGWLLFEQEKMSKSKGNVAYPEPIVKTLGNDALRYYLLRETVFGQDGNFSREAMITRYEADLVSGLGNLASRVLTLIETHFGGRVPERGPESDVLEPYAREATVGALANLNALRFSMALDEIWRFIGRVDTYLTQKQPWKRIKDSEKRRSVGAVLYGAAEAIRFTSILAHPVIPDGTEVIWKHLGQPGPISEQNPEALSWSGLVPGTVVTKPAATFPRIDKKEAMEKIEAMENEIRNLGAAQSAAAGAGTAAPAGPAGSGTPSQPSGSPATSHSTLATSSSPETPKISVDDLSKVDLRVGVIKSAERIHGADKLLKLQVDIGDEVRQILAGIALAYAPEELVGRKIVVVANLAPRKMRGLESNGMLLAASVEGGKPVLCTFGEDIQPGAKVK